MSIDNTDPSTDRQQLRADQVVAMARRHAEEIRRAAEQEAERLLEESERRAAVLRQAQLDAHQHEVERIALSRDHLKNCFTVAESALARVREAGAMLAAMEPVQSRPDVPSLAPDHENGTSGQPTVGRFARIGSWLLGTWAVLMLTMWALVSHRPVSVDAAANTPALLDAEVVAPAPEPKQSSTPAPVSNPTQAPRAEPTTAAVAEQTPLTVAFIAARDCWISVATDGSLPRERLLKASETHVVHAREAVTFKAGNAAALSVVINDRPARPLGAEGQVVTWQVSRANYQSFL